MTAVSSRYLSRGIDYLGNLAAKLRDLRGLATLAHELIQNADDARDVSKMCFDVQPDALVVTNDAAFSDCGAVEEDECPWKGDAQKGYRCDFHRFRFVASGDKRRQPETAGAFGIGFIAVYQITDAPEVISAGRHWLLHEERPENERIEICAGCPKCRSPRAPTWFYLPWATDQQSALRTALNVEAVTADTASEFVAELRRSLPQAMLFLKRLSSIEVRDQGESVVRLERIVEADSLILAAGDKDEVWHIVKGDFDQEALELRAVHGPRIEDKRRSHVMLAIPSEPLAAGLLCATLPTQHESGLGIHINADYFPTNDRKRVIFEADYQSDWNRAAIEAAAQTLASQIGSLARRIGHTHIWTIIEAVCRVAGEAKAGRFDRSFATFAEKLKPLLRSEAIVRTTNSHWCTATEAVLLYEKRETKAIPLLEKLGISIVHDDLRPFHNLLRGQDVGVGLLEVHHLAAGLEGAGLTSRITREELPDFLKSDDDLRQLWQEVSSLISRQRRPDEQSEAKSRLSTCAIALGRDGALWPCRELYRADTETQVLFKTILPSLPFVADMGEEGRSIEDLCAPLAAQVVIDALEHIDHEAFEKAWCESRVQLSELFRWFERQSVDDSERQRLAKLSLFPSSGRLRPLVELALPGDFVDPIGLAGVIDLSQLENRRDFLRELGAKELTLTTYFTGHVPRAFENDQLTPKKKREVVSLLANRMSGLRDDPHVKDVLSGLALVECTDEIFRIAMDTYFPGEVVTAVLGKNAPRALLSPMAGESLRELYFWLGVAEGPRMGDIVARVDKLVSEPPNQQSIRQIQSIFRHLGIRAANNPDEVGPEPLKTKQWLSARDEDSRWFRPAELYAVFQDYLFQSQANFLDIPKLDQERSTSLLEFLGVKLTPEVSLVVNHLIKYAEEGRPVNKAIYQFLNDKSDEAPVGRLKNTACLLISESKYVKPSRVFWGEHPFGRFRHRLGQELRKYSDLFEKLGVREGPDHTSALQVLIEIEQGLGSNILDDEALIVLHESWKMLEQALINESLSRSSLAGLKQRKVIPNAKRVLSPPEWVFFEDVPGLAAKFGSFLENNVIVRMPGAWRAMAAAGVRSLSDAVVAKLAECEDPRRDEEFENTIIDRRAQLARVLESHSSGLAARLDQLQSFQAQSVTSLAVQYTLHAFRQNVSSNPEAVPAHYHRESNELYFVKQDGRVPWNSISRELAALLCPEVEPGRLAPGIKEVLAADTADQARQVLDELGCPELEAPPISPLVTAEIVEDLGGEDPPEPSQPASPPPAASHNDSGGQLEESKTTDELENVEQALDALLGGDRSSPIPPPAGLGKEDAPTTGQKTRSHAATQAGRTTSTDNGHGNEQPAAASQAYRPPGGRLRTYVIPDGNGDPASKEDPIHHASRSAVEQAAVRRVLEYERTQGRHPVEMPPLHEGYDVESKNSPDGRTERYIEIKGRAYEWGSLGVGLTRSQFAKASTLGNLYWLYVVESAEKEDFEIHCIQDPARRVNQFLYDDGWRNLSEGAVNPASQQGTEDNGES